MRYAFFYEGGVRCDGHGFLRDNLDTVHLKISFPDHEVGCTTVKENNTGGVDFDNNPVTNPNCMTVITFLGRVLLAGSFNIIYVRPAEQHVSFLTKTFVDFFRNCIVIIVSWVLRRRDFSPWPDTPTAASCNLRRISPTLLTSLSLL